MNVCSRLLMFLSNFKRKTSNLGIRTPSLGSYGWRMALVDGLLESPWSTFYSP